MAYLDTNARTNTNTSNDRFQPIGRTTVLFGVFVGFVKEVQDVQRNGRLKVWIPELGATPDNPDGWVIVNYCSPFAGATNSDNASKTDIQSSEGTQTSYGMWMIPPDINNQVLVMFANGDPARGFWIGCLYNQYMNNMVPAIASSASNYQHPGKVIPVSEYNKWDLQTTIPDRAIKPYEKTKFQGIGNQGLITDRSRGITTSSARREAPSTVFGILTPGPPINPDVSQDRVRRKGGSSFVMDDESGSEYIQLTTKSGAQIKLDETNGFIYMINRDGTAWVQMDKDGNIDIFGARDISMRAQRDFNIRADRNVNIEAGQNIYVKAAKDTKEETTEFTYDVNNVPDKKTIPVWKYKGEGNGDGGDIVMQAKNNWQSTTQNSAFLTVIDNDMNINIGNTLNVQTKGSQNFNALQSIKMSTEGTFDIAAKGNIRVGSEGTVSVTGIEGVIICSDTEISINSSGELKMAAAGNASLSAAAFGIYAPTTISGGLILAGDGGRAGGSVGTITGDMVLNGNMGITGTLDVLGKTTLGEASAVHMTADLTQTAGPPPNVVVTPPTPAPELNPTPAEGAQSAPGARSSEVKPMNGKTNILATWGDPESKFKRNSEQLTTTTSRFPTYEPCPEHGFFNTSVLTDHKVVLNDFDKTYDGSSGKGNPARTQPLASTTPGTNNTSVTGDGTGDNNVSKDLDIAALRHQLFVHEAVITTIYLDSTKKLHGGVGHLLRQDEIPRYPLGSPVSEQQIETWYVQDSTAAIKIAEELMDKQWVNLTDIRKRAVIDMSFNLGKARLAKFVKFISSMRAGEWNEASKELKDSLWYDQVGYRAKDIQTMVVQNVDPTVSMTPYKK
jgi:GH24 family phage-related lysozyme (muramidase)